MPAEAKQIKSAAICGADGCKQVEVPRGDHALVAGGPLSGSPARPAPFYRLRFAIGDRRSGKVFERFTNLYVPSARRLRASGTWMRLLPRTARALRRATAGREPFPAHKLPAAMLERSGTSLAPEVVLPPREATGEREDGAPGGWAAGVAGVVLLGGGLAALRRRRRS